MLETAIVLLAGGAARRFPGKLERSVEGEPLILRAYRNARSTGLPVYVAAKGAFPRAIDDRLDCPAIVDRHPGQGPLAALFSACSTIRADAIFAVAADQPYVGSSVLQALLAERQPPDEAVVPRHDRSPEPLAALYRRTAVLREASVLLRAQQRAMHALTERLTTRFVELPARYFLNINTPEDLT